MTCILVATDGSPDSDRAVDYAAAQATNADIDLLIVTVLGGYGLPGEVFRQFTRAQQTWLDEVLDSHAAEILNKARERAHAGGAAMIRLEARRGDVAQTVLAVADEQDADAIVVGKRGAGRIGGLLLGSVSQKLVSLATRVVIVVP